MASYAGSSSASSLLAAEEDRDEKAMDVVPDGVAYHRLCGMVGCDSYFEECQARVMNLLLYIG